MKPKRVNDKKEVSWSLLLFKNLLTMEVSEKLKQTLQEDIDSSFNKLVEECSIGEMSRTIKKAEKQLNDELNNDISEHVKDGLKKAFDLIDLLKKSKKESSKKMGVAALEYLLDPWDIIPDFISEDGFLDDIYVINRAIKSIKEEQTVTDTKSEIEYQSNVTAQKEWLILKIGGAAGPHLAKRAKNMDILDGYQRRALYDIGRKHLQGYKLTRKQHTFFETLIEDSVSEGILDNKCPDSPCKYCNELKNIFS